MMLCTMLLGGVVGCSSQEGSKPNQTQSNELNQNKTEQLESNDEVNEDPVYTAIYGKVKKVIGNEIELSLAMNPYDELEDGEGDSEMSDSFAPEMADSIQLLPDADPELVEQFGEPDTIISPTAGMELEYTGEEESYIIPTGVNIMNYKTFSEGSMNDIKEGSVICLTVSETNNNQTIHMIDILE